MSELILIKSNNKIYSLKSEEILHETKMTSDTTPAPFVASASSVYSTTYSAWKAFSGFNTAETDCWLTPNNTTKGYIQIDFGETKMLSKIDITSRNHTTAPFCSPKDFDVLGSNDGVRFKVLKSFRNISDWKQNEIKSFNFSLSEFRYFRIEVMSNVGVSGSWNYIGIGQILFSYIENLTEIPSSSIENFINYGSSSINNFNLIDTNKNYILQDTVSEDTDGLWKQDLNRKPLSIKFE